MEWYLTILVAYLSFSKASAVILEGPRGGVYPEGTNVTLQCVAQGSNRIVWEDINENTVIFIDKAKNTQKAKFDNFVISEAEGNFSLTIVDAQISDDGFYSCEEGDESRNANVTVEAAPTLSISLNDTLLAIANPVTLTEDEVIVVVCKAEGSKPAVDLRLKFGGDWIQVVNVTKLKEGLRSTTKAKIVHRVTNTDANFTCQAFGQNSIPPVTKVIHIDIRYKPKCQIYQENNLAKCQCVSNPAASTYKIYVDGELISTYPTLPVQEYLPANVTCQAINDVGTGRLASKFLTPVDDKDSTNIVLVIIIVVAIAVAVVVGGGCLIFTVFRRRHRKSTINNFVQLTETSARNEEEQKPLVQDGKDSHDFQTFVSEIAETIHRDWEILAVEDLKLQNDEVKKIIEEEPICHVQVKLAIQLWTEKEEGEISKSELARTLSHSPVCNDFQCNKCIDVLRSIPGVILHHPGTAEANAVTLTENEAMKTQDESTKKYPTESEKFTALLENVSKVIGHTGALKLSKEYDVDKKEENSTVKDLSIIGEDIIRLLVERGLLDHSITSLNGFQEKLEGFCLFRASNVVGAYILQEEMELHLAEYISEISRNILFDWEILAIDNLKVDKSTVEEIIKTYTNREDQVKAVLHVWQKSVAGGAKRCDLEEIINHSENFIDNKKLSELQISPSAERNEEADTDSSSKYSSNENGSGKKTNIPSKFQELLKHVSEVLGETGIGRILEAYHKQTDEEPVQETLTPRSIFQLLQNKEILADNWESLKLFSFRLKSCSLYRASYLVDAYVDEKEKAKLITTEGSVPVAPNSSSLEGQREQESQANHESTEEQEDLEVQSSSENLEETNTEHAESEVT